MLFRFFPNISFSFICVPSVSQRLCPPVIDRYRQKCLSCAGMTYDQLKYHLPVFLVFFSLIVFYWSRLRTKKASLSISLPQHTLVKRIKKVNSFFYIIYLVVCAKVVIYVFFPAFYSKISLPFVVLDVPPVNTAGVMIMNLSLVWVIVVQMNLDMLLFRLISGKMEPAMMQKMMIYSEKSMLLGFLIMLIGLFVTVSNLATLVLAVAGIVVYYLFFMRYNGNNTPDKVMMIW